MRIRVRRDIERMVSEMGVSIPGLSYESLSALSGVISAYSQPEV